MSALEPIATYTPDTSTSLKSPGKDQTQLGHTFPVGAGQVLTLKYAIPDGGGVTVAAPTDSQGLTWTQRVISTDGTTATAIAIIWTSSPAVAGTLTVTAAAPTGGRWQRAVIEVWPAGTTVGATLAVNPSLTDGAPSGTMTTVGTESAITALIVDWQGRSGTRTFSVAVTEEFWEQSSSIGSHYQFRQAAATPGAKGIGMTSPANQRWGLVAVEMVQPSSGSALTANVSDPVGITDTGAPMTFDIGEAIADPAGVTDSTSAAQALVRGPGEQVALADAAAPVLGASRTQADAVGLADTVAVTWSRSTAITDQVGAVDVATPDQVAPGSASVVETQSVTDAAAAVQDARRAAGDTVSLVDAVTTILDRVRGAADAVSAADGVDALLAAVAGQGLPEIEALTDTTSVQRDVVRQPSDLEGITDGLAAELNRARTPSDGLGLVDDVGVLLIRSGNHEPPGSRTRRVPPETRTTTVPAETRTVRSKERHMFAKDPSSELDFRVDWSSWLQDGEAIVTSTWQVPACLTEVNDAGRPTTHDATTATIWLAGGTTGARLAVTNRVVTDQGRVDERSFQLRVLQR